MILIHRLSSRAVPSRISLDLLRNFAAANHDIIDYERPAFLRVYFDSSYQITRIVEFQVQDDFQMAKNELSRWCFADISACKAEVLSRCWQNTIQSFYCYFFSQIAHPKSRARTDAGECHICLGDICADNLAVQLRCGHRFHALCYLEWQLQGQGGDLAAQLGSRDLCVFGCRM